MSGSEKEQPVNYWPILFQYLASMYPKFKSVETIEDFKCAITAPQASSVVNLSNSVLSYYFALAYLLVQQ